MPHQIDMAQIIRHNNWCVDGCECAHEFKKKFKQKVPYYPFYLNCPTASSALHARRTLMRGHANEQLLPNSQCPAAERARNSNHLVSNALKKNIRQWSGKCFEPTCTKHVFFCPNSKKNSRKMHFTARRTAVRGRAGGTYP